MRILIFTALALPLAACAGYSEPAPAPSPPSRDAMFGACDAAPAQAHVGREATEEAGAAILAMHRISGVLCERRQKNWESILYSAGRS